MTLEERNKLVNEIQTRSTKITNEAQKMMGRWDDENDETFYYKEINEIYKYSEEIKDIVTKYAEYVKKRKAEGKIKKQLDKYGLEQRTIYDFLDE